jgi:HD-like signal output (HDOD) protein
MLEHALPDLESWVLHLSEQELPVLRQTKRQLEELHENIDRISGRDIARVVLQDPLMAVRVLSYTQPYHGRHLQHEITTVSRAIMMLGIEPFFRYFENLPTIEETLKGQNPKALLGVVQVIRRIQRATHYAQEWAIWRHDTNIDEVAIATLLHDLAEILVWCFAPKLALRIQDMQKSNPNLRSAVAQLHVLGVRLIDLQLSLARQWNLPGLLQALIDDNHAEHPRVRNVVLAVNLARHSANGWDDPALPDDYAQIEDLLHVNHQALMDHLGLPVRSLDKLEQIEEL